MADITVTYEGTVAEERDPRVRVEVWAVRINGEIHTTYGNRAEAAGFARGLEFGDEGIVQSYE